MSQKSVGRRARWQKLEEACKAAREALPPEVAAKVEIRRVGDVAQVVRVAETPVAK